MWSPSRRLICRICNNGAAPRAEGRSWCDHMTTLAVGLGSDVCQNSPSARTVFTRRRQVAHASWALALVILAIRWWRAPPFLTSPLEPSRKDPHRACLGQARSLASKQILRMLLGCPWAAT